MHTSPRDNTDVASNDGDVDRCGIFWKRSGCCGPETLSLFQLNRTVFLQYSSSYIIFWLTSIQSLLKKLQDKTNPSLAFVALQAQTASFQSFRCPLPDTTLPPSLPLPVLASTSMFCRPVALLGCLSRCLCLPYSFHFRHPSPPCFICQEVITS